MSESMKPTFAGKLKAIREKVGITQAQLAEQSGLHLGAVFKLEQGKREPSWETVQALAKALGVNCLSFSEDAPAPPPTPDAKPGRPRKAAASDQEPAAKKRKGK